MVLVFSDFVFTEVLQEIRPDITREIWKSSKATKDPRFLPRPASLPEDQSPTTKRFPSPRWTSTLDRRDGRKACRSGRLWSGPILPSFSEVRNPA